MKHIELSSKILTKSGGWFALVALLSLHACFLDDCFVSETPGFCDETRPCSELEFCDLTGQFEELTNTCTARPECEAGCFGQVPVCDEAEGLCRFCSGGDEGDAECVAADELTPVCAASGGCEACATHDQCPDSAPQCLENGSCDSCVDGDAGDSVCTERDETLSHCLAGSCVACLGADNEQDSDCTDATQPICEANACRGCQQHDECTGTGFAGICNKVTGVCVRDNAVVHAKPGGSAGETCGVADIPCNLKRALELVGEQASKTTIQLEDGDYMEDNLVVTANVLVFGDAESKSAVEPVGKDIAGLTIVGDVNVVLDSVRVTGARAETTDDEIELADGIHCSLGAKLSLFDVTIDDNGDTGIDGGDCTIRIEEGSSVDGNDGGGISVASGTLTIEDSSVDGNDGGGISVVSGTLTIEDSSVDGTKDDDISSSTGTGVVISDGSLSMRSSSVVNYTAGGLEVERTDFTVLNSFFVRNGSVVSVFGGVSLQNPDERDLLQRFEFNTVFGNRSANGAEASGVICNTQAGADMVARNNIVFTSESNAPDVTPPGVSNGCAWEYSNIGIVTAGIGNTNADPMLASSDSFPFLPENFKLTENSPGVDAADPNATVVVDFEGGTRPNNGRSDMGADELGAVGP